jgi:site-specific DNA-methyltransferase (adenine-specific)
MTYDIKPGAVINADCLTVLRQMEPDSVDMVITDPPYGVNYQSTRAAKENRKGKISNDKSPFIWWIYDAYRVLREGGLLCFSRWDVQQVFMDALKIAGFAIKSVLIWDRMHHGMGDLKGSFAPRYDTCIFATKGRYILPGGRPADVIQCQRLNGVELVHPNEKPVALLRQLIESTTAPGALILDPFAGSGSTLVAAALTGRQYIGVEIDTEYHKIAQTRARDALKERLLKGTET